MNFENEKPSKTEQIPEHYEIEKKVEDTPRKAEARFYLTKIANLLLPENIPDVEMDEESKSVAEKSRLQEIMMEITGEVSDEESIAVDEELHKIGLAFNIENSSMDSYIKNESGKVQYIDTFEPWKRDIANPGEIEVLFGIEEMEEAISNIEDEETQEQCKELLEKLMILVEEAKQDPIEYEQQGLEESSEHIKELEDLFEELLENELIEKLNSIETKEEAEDSTEREEAKQKLAPVFKKLRVLEDTNISDEKMGELQDKYKKISQAIGIINSGLVDHTR